jgi:hypothetical protein
MKSKSCCDQLVSAFFVRCAVKTRTVVWRTSRSFYRGLAVDAVTTAGFAIAGYLVPNVLLAIVAVILGR